MKEKAMRVPGGAASAVVADQARGIGYVLTARGMVRAQRAEIERQAARIAELEAENAALRKRSEREGLEERLWAAADALRNGR